MVGDVLLIMAVSTGILAVVSWVRQFIIARRLKRMSDHYTTMTYDEWIAEHEKERDA